MKTLKNKIQTLILVILPSIKVGIISSIFLGFNFLPCIYNSAIISPTSKSIYSKGSKKSSKQNSTYLSSSASSC